MRLADYRRSTASVQLLVAFAVETGLSPIALLRGSGISADELTDPNVEIGAVNELKVIANFLKAAGARPGLGLEVGLRYRATTYGLWGYGLISSATAADALTLALRYLPLTYVFTRVSRHDGDGRVCLRFDESDFADDIRRFVIERDMAAAASLMQELIGDDFALHYFRLRASGRRNAVGARMTRILGAVPAYASPENEIAFDAGLLVRRLSSANPVTAALCEQLCAELIERRGRQRDTSGQVRQHLEIAAAGRERGFPALAQVAAQLHLSERTLKRRLQSEGTSFRLLLEAQRRQSAAELMRNHRLNLTQIADVLGFADLSSFSQAYKRWYGVAPSNATMNRQSPE